MSFATQHPEIRGLSSGEGVLAGPLVGDHRFYGGITLRQDIHSLLTEKVGKAIHRALEPDEEWPDDLYFTDKQTEFNEIAASALHNLGIVDEIFWEEGTLKSMHLLPDDEELGPQLTMILVELAFAAAEQNAPSGDQAWVPLDTPNAINRFFPRRFILGAVEYLQTLGVILDWQWDAPNQDLYIQLKEPACLDTDESGVQDVMRKREEQGAAFEPISRRGRLIRSFPAPSARGRTDEG